MAKTLPVTLLYLIALTVNSWMWSQQFLHYGDVIMGTIASQITSLAIVYLSVYSGADQRKHQSPASLAFVWGIHRGPVNSPHKWPVPRKMFPFDDVIMDWYWIQSDIVWWSWMHHFSLCAAQQGAHRVYVAGIRMRTALTAALYRKVRFFSCFAVLFNNVYQSLPKKA